MMKDGVQVLASHCDTMKDRVQVVAPLCCTGGGYKAYKAKGSTTSLKASSMISLLLVIASFLMVRGTTVGTGLLMACGVLPAYLRLAIA
jgi:uncharacterized membrane protein (UPF0136 family)